jgi:hypothetical protein
MRVMHVQSVLMGSVRSSPDGIYAGQRHVSVPGSSEPFEGIRRQVAPVVAPVATRRSRAYGLYRFDEIPRTGRDQFMEAVFRVGREAYLTHHTVLALHDLALVNPRRIRVGTRKRARPQLPEYIEIVQRRLEPAAPAAQRHRLKRRAVPSNTARFQSKPRNRSQAVFFELAAARRLAAPGDRLGLTFPIGWREGLLFRDFLG